MNRSMDPLDLALRHITETQRLLEQLIHSSESFDYLHAKKCLHELRRKARALGKAKSKMTANQPAGINICCADFSKKEPFLPGE
jgi:hypothetical protein